MDSDLTNRPIWTPEKKEPFWRKGNGKPPKFQRKSRWRWCFSNLALWFSDPNIGETTIITITHVEKNGFLKVLFYSLICSWLKTSPKKVSVEVVVCFLNPFWFIRIYLVATKNCLVFVLHPGRLTAGTYSHHPWKERKIIFHPPPTIIVPAVKSSVPCYFSRFCKW